MNEEIVGEGPPLAQILKGEAEALGFRETPEMRALHQRLLSLEEAEFNRRMGDYIDLSQKMITKISIGLMLMQASINQERGITEYVLTSMEDAMNYCHGMGEGEIVDRIETKIKEIEAKAKLA